MVSLFEVVGLSHRYHVVPGVGHGYPSGFCEWVDSALEFVLDTGATGSGERPPGRWECEAW